MNKRYVDRKRLYSGHHSDVYRAIDSTSNETVCLKIVDCDMRVKPHDIKREIRILKRLSHPGIIPWLDNYEWQDDIVLVIPYHKYDLKSLLDHYSTKSMKHNFVDPSKSQIVSKNNLPEDKVEQMILKISQALAYLHDQGIIHRDLKPSNIFFEDKPEEPVLADFGISYESPKKASQEKALFEQDSRTLNTSGHEAPTIAAPNLDGEESENCKYTDVSTGIYKAPELCLGINNYGFEIDVWALGIIMTVLYSKHSQSVLEPADGDEYVLSDLYLINAIFNNFGTPTLEPNHQLSWPELDNDRYHFKAFQFVNQPRKGYEVLIPKCTNSTYKHLFDRIVTYDREKRITAKQIVDQLETGSDLDANNQ